ncbi:MAG: hypothetical protein WC807_18945 [Hyphomicrobium sp.]|jgi:hypothetical protein
MSKIFALLALVLIASGGLLLAVPREAPIPAGLAPQSAGPEAKEELPGTRSVGPAARKLPDLVVRARDIAEQVNAPLSIIFGLVSLVYSRRTYLLNKERAEALAARAA